MKRLGNGLYAVTEDSGCFTGIYSLDDSEMFHPVRCEDTPELVKLAQGELGDGHVSKILSELDQAGLLARSKEISPDPRILQALDELGAPFRWRVHPNNHPVLGKVRAWHAHRKLFVFEFGQTPCLPETVLCRVQLATENLPPNAKVLLIGDDDLMCLALAELGFEVTVVDIDKALIDFIQHRCQQDNIQVDARVQDLLQPIPDDMQSKFDLVITDPMSFEGCLIAFLSRALSMAKATGVVWTCIHPLAHQLFEKVAKVLPIQNQDRAAFLSAYYYRRYETNTYRSDFFRLKKTSAPLPYAPNETIPFEAITEGELTSTLHSHIHCQLATPNVSDGPAAPNPFENLSGDFFTSHSETHYHFSQNQPKGYVAGSLNRRKTNLHMQFFPFSEEDEEQQSQKLLANFPILTRRITYMEAPFLAPLIMGDAGSQSKS